MVVIRIVLAAVLSGVAIGAAAQAQPNVQLPKTEVVAPPPLSVKDFVRYPDIASPVLSPNGKFFAATAPINGRLNLVVIDLETRKGAALTNFSNFDVISVDWVGNDRILYSLGQFNTPTGPGVADGGGLFVVSREGKEPRTLSPTTRECRNRGERICRGYDLIRTLPNNDEEVIASGNMRSADSSDVYRLNVRTGRGTLLTETRPSNVQSWVLDRNQVPRVARAWIKDTQTYAIHYRKSESAPWEEIARFDATVGPAFVPLAFEADNETLLVATNEGRDTMAVFKYDPNSRKLGEVVAQHPRYDMGANSQGDRVPGVLRDPATDNIVGYRVQGDKPETVWTDANYMRIQRMLDGALPGRINAFSRTPDGDRLLVTSYSDRQPVKWYFLDEKKKTLEEVLASRPWIKPENLVEMRPFLLKTRDGLEIPSYYFLPRDHKPGQKLPTVLHIHGGPTVRADRWGEFTYGVREAQILASRGYAVVVPNFRGTPGPGFEGLLQRVRGGRPADAGGPRGRGEVGDRAGLRGSGPHLHRGCELRRLRHADGAGEDARTVQVRGCRTVGQRLGTHHGLDCRRYGVQPGRRGVRAQADRRRQESECIARSVAREHGGTHERGAVHVGRRGRHPNADRADPEHAERARACREPAEGRADQARRRARLRLGRQQRRAVRPDAPVPGGADRAEEALTVRDANVEGPRKRAFLLQRRQGGAESAAEPAAWPSACSAARAIAWRSTSKNARSAARVSDRPNPSVPRAT